MKSSEMNKPPFKFAIKNPQLVAAFCERIEALDWQDKYDLSQLLNILLFEKNEEEKKSAEEAIVEILDNEPIEVKRDFLDEQ